MANAPPTMPASLPWVLATSATTSGCQPRPPCLGNQDCDEGEICNSADATGRNVHPRRLICGSTVHCGFNEYCNPTTGACEEGCRNVGDCRLGYVCQNNSCVPGDCSTCPTSPTVDATYWQPAKFVPAEPVFLMRCKALCARPATKTLPVL